MVVLTVAPPIEVPVRGDSGDDGDVFITARSSSAVWDHRFIYATMAMKTIKVRANRQLFSRSAESQKATRSHQQQHGIVHKIE